MDNQPNTFDGTETEILTPEQCVLLFQEIHAQAPSIPNDTFREAAHLAYPKNCELMKGLKQKIWVQTLEKFLVDRKKLLKYQNG